MTTHITREKLIATLPYKNTQDTIIGETVWLTSDDDCIFFTSQNTSATNPLRKYTVWHYLDGQAVRLSEPKQYAYRSGVHRRCKTEYTKATGLPGHTGISLLDVENGTYDDKMTIQKLESTLAVIRYKIQLLTNKPYIPNMQAFRDSMFPSNEEIVEWNDNKGSRIQEDKDNEI